MKNRVKAETLNLIFKALRLKDDLMVELVNFINSNFEYEIHTKMDISSVIKTLKKRQDLNQNLLNEEEIALQLETIIKSLESQSEKWITVHCLKNDDKYILVYSSEDLERVHGVFNGKP